MIQSIFNNIFSMGADNKYRVQPTKEILEIKKKLAQGVSVDDLSKEEYTQLSVFEKAESAAFYQEIFQELGKAEKIARKIAKGEGLTPEEERFMNESYPDMKREAQQAKSEAEQLKERLKGCKSKAQKQQIIGTAMGSVAAMASKGALSQIQVAVKMEALQKVKEEAESEGAEPLEVKIDNYKGERGIFINKTT